MAEKFVRIRTGNGMESSVSTSYADGIEGVDVIDEPATNTWGRPLPATRRNGRPAKPRTTASKAAARKRAAKKAAAPAAGSTTPTTGGPAADSPEEGTE